MAGLLRLIVTTGLVTWVIFGARHSCADDASPVSSNMVAGSIGDQSLWSKWQSMVARTQDEQPHWITPLVTTTPLLTQSFHYDLFFQELPGGSRLNNYGGGKGLEVIPNENMEVILAVPPYERLTGPISANGFGDWPSVLMKYRALSANREQGDYAVTGFLQITGDNGAKAFSTGTDILQPAIAFGKGWNDFDLQVNIGEQFPLGSNRAAQNFGKPILVNVVAQQQLWGIVWPEIEANYTWWPDGARKGKSQIFLTPGIIFGPFPITKWLTPVVGVGCQFALSPRVPTYNHNLIVTMRLPF